MYREPIFYGDKLLTSWETYIVLIEGVDLLGLRFHMPLENAPCTGGRVLGTMSPAQFELVVGPRGMCGIIHSITTELDPHT